MANSTGYVDPLLWQQQQAKSMNVPPAGTNQQPVVSSEAGTSMLRGGAATGATATQLPRDVGGSSSGSQTGDRLTTELQSSQPNPSSYFGQINPATGNVYDYQAIATKLGLPVADVERIGMQGQMNAWNQNVAGGGAYAGQPMWTDVYAGGSAYVPVNHTRNGAMNQLPMSLAEPSNAWSGGEPSILARDSNGLPVGGSRDYSGGSTSLGGYDRPVPNATSTNGPPSILRGNGGTNGGGNVNPDTNQNDPYGFPKGGNSQGGGFNIDPYLMTQLNRIQENKPYNDLATEKGSRLTEALRASEATDSEQAANALAAHGITGGQAMSQLGRVKRNYALGLSQGLGQIEQENLQGNINARNLALQAGLNLKGLQTNAQLGNRQMDITKMLGLEGIAKDYAQMEMNNIVQMKQLGLSSQQIAMDAAIRLAGVAAQLDANTLNSLLDFYKVTTGYDLSQLVQLPQTGGTNPKP